MAWVRHLSGDKGGRAYAHLVSAELTRTWHEHTGRELTIVSGTEYFTEAVTFYSADHPDGVPDFNWTSAPWVTPGRRADEGWAIICRADEAACLAAAQDEAAQAGPAGVIKETFTAQPTFWGVRGKPENFVLILLPPG